MFADLQIFIVLILSVLAFGLEGFALVDAVRTRADAFVVAGKQTKTLWLVVLGVAAAFGLLALLAAAGGGGVLSPLGLLPIVAVVAAAVYLTDVRPAVRQIRGGGGGRSAGPYGPWCPAPRSGWHSRVIGRLLCDTNGRYAGTTAAQTAVLGRAARPGAPVSGTTTIG